MFHRLLYPSFCRSCNKLIEQNAVFCCECDKKIKPIVSVFLPITSKHSLKVFAVSDYKNPLRSLILKKSFSDMLACKQLAKLILQKTPIKDLDIDYIVSIPLHWTRYAKRGFNQSHVMSSVLGKGMNVPTLKLLRRKKRTVFQSKLSSDERQINVKGVFDLSFRYKSKDLSFLKDKNILLVDDLCTTGATLKNAARVLLKFKPKSISAAVACRVV
jgi:ComF family protein